MKPLNALWCYHILVGFVICNVFLLGIAPTNIYLLVSTPVFALCAFLLNRYYISDDDIVDY